MSGARIHAICVVKDEEDIIAQTLTFAARFCEQIFVLDNGSSDETWNIVRGLAETSRAIVPFRQTAEPFDNGLRATVYNEIHANLSANDWWLILDGDEFLAEDPQPLIEAAEASCAERINAWHIQFFFTDRDAQEWDEGRDTRDRPVFERRRYYTINWQECRLFRNCPRREWDVRAGNHLPHWLGPVARRRILNRHYQYRDPEQMEKRLRLRHGHQQFSHVQSTDWRSMIRDSRQLNFHADGDPWRFSLSGVSYFYRHAWSERIRAAWHGGALRRVKRALTAKGAGLRAS